MRVLVVVPFPLHPEGSAAARCMLGLMRGLAMHGVDAHALTVAARGQYVLSPPPEVAAETAYVDYPGTWRARRDRLIAPYSAYRRGDFGQRLAELSTEVDLVHVHGIAAGAMLGRIHAPTVVQLDCLTRSDRDLEAPWTRDGRIALEMYRAERRTCRRAHWLLGSSGPVAAGLARTAPRAHVEHAALSLDPAYYPDTAPLTEPVAGLIGTAVWPPTADAVRRLLTRVWPRVLARRPSAQLLLAGRGMDRSRFGALPSPPGVRWLGAVESAEAFLQGLGVLLYPLDRGSGVKVKVLESMALGVPVVTTPRGAEGIVGTDGLVVDTDDDALAEATCRLLDDGEARRRAGDAVREQFQAHHTPAPATAAVIELYERML